ncbi:MAG: hypothetical protein ACRD6B_15925 [Bryobacteraceae bacterium]
MHCSREIAFGHLVPGTIPSGRILLIFENGTWYHTTIQRVLTDTLGAADEVKVDFQPTYPVSGSADAVFRDEDGLVVVVEIKSMNPYAFAYASGKRTRAAGPGPELAHVIQAAIYAISPQLNATSVLIVYVDKSSAEMASWLLDLDLSYPTWLALGDRTLREAASTELERLAGIGALITSDPAMLPKRYIPGTGTIEEPLFDRACRWCDYRELCATLPTGRTAMPNA